MPPRRSMRHVNNNMSTNPPPTPQYDPSFFQAAVTAAVTAALTRINASGTSAVSGGANHSNDEESHRNPRECT